MQRNVLFGMGGLVIGLIIGFFASNSINRNAVSQENLSQNFSNVPFQNQQIQNASVKEPQGPGGMLADVKQIVDKANSDPKDFDAQLRAGDMYAQIKRFEQAAEFYDRADALNTADYEKLVRLANSYFTIEQYEKAEKLFAKALEQRPDDFEVRTDLGTTFVERGDPDYDRAIREFQTSLQRSPKHEPTLYNLGVAYYKKGDREKAEKVLGQLEEISPGSQLAARLKQVLSQS